MKLKRIFQKISDLSARHKIPKGILDEGRIFYLGEFNNSDYQNSRVVEVVDGLKDHVGQPFGLHPWVFIYDIVTKEQNGITSPTPLVGVVWPQSEGKVVVQDHIAMRRVLKPVGSFLFSHTPRGTIANVPNADGNEDQMAPSLYPFAIAVLNTRGCTIDLKRAPAIENMRLKRIGKPTIPAHYNIDASEYFTALQAPKDTADRGGTHASPIPHLRRAHERVLADGRRIWIPSALINVRKEGDIAFVERRKSYKRKAH